MNNQKYKPIYDINELPKYDKLTIETVLNRLSYSKISTLFSCPKFFELTYLYGVKGPVSDNTIKGTKLHAYYQKCNEGIDTSAEAYQVAYNEFYHKFQSEALKFEKLWLPFKKALTDKGYSQFYEHYLKVDFTDKFKFPCSLGGYLDFFAINKEGTEAIVIDYKSTDSIGPEYIDQAIIYALLVFSNYPNIKEIKTYIYDISDSTLRTFIKSNSFCFKKENEIDIKKSLLKILTVAQDILKKANFYISPSKKCYYCPLLPCKYNRLKKDYYETNKRKTQEITEDTFLKDNNIQSGETSIFKEIKTTSTRKDSDIYL